MGCLRSRPVGRGASVVMRGRFSVTGEHTVPQTAKPFHAPLVSELLESPTRVYDSTTGPT